MCYDKIYLANGNRGVKVESNVEPKVESKFNDTRQNLLYHGIKLFSQYGYEATSPRMIAKEAKTNLSAISFYFLNKKNFYISCINYVAEKLNQYYEDAFRRINESIQKKTINPETAYNYICELIDLQISSAFKSKYRKTLKLVYWEQVNPIGDFHPLTESIFEKIEKVFAELLVIAANNKISYESAVIASRFINGSIISFGEHDLIVRYSLNINNSEELPEFIQNEIRYYCLLLVKDFLWLGSNQRSVPVELTSSTNLPQQ